MSSFRFGLLAFVALLTACGSSTPIAGGSATGTGALHGKARLDGEATARGITVVLSGPSSRAAVTLDDGTFRFEKLEPGTYLISASAPSTDPGSVSTTVSVASTGEGEASDLVLKPFGTVTGTVTLGSSMGNSGIAVAIAGTPAVAVTDDAGHFTLTRVPTGARQLVASYPGFGSGTANVTVRYDNSVEASPLTLTRGGLPGSIQGKVKLTGEASAENISVSLAGPTPSFAQTDASGQYTFTSLLPGKYVVSAAARSTLEGVVTATVNVTSELAMASDLTLSPLGNVTGKVTLGKPSGNAGIVVSLVGTPAVTVTDDSGAFALNNVPTGAWSLATSVAGYVLDTPRSATVRYAQTTTLPEVVLVKSIDPGAITGVVQLPNVHPLPSLTATLSGPVSAATVVDPQTGSFSFNGLKPGAYTVSVSAPSTAEGTLSTNVAVDQQSVAVNPFTFSPLGSISGTATLSAPTGNAGITLSVAGNSALAVTNDAGAFTLRNVPVGLATVVASYPGYAAATLPNVVVTYASTASAPPFTLQKTTLPGGISGVAKVSGETTQPAMTVVLTGPTTGATQTSATGEYSFSGLPAGTYNLTVQAPSTQEGSLSTTVTVAQTTVTASTLAFTPVGTLTGFATLGGQTSHAGITVTVPGTQVIAVTDATGAFTLKGVPAGSWTVSASAPGYTMAASPATTVRYAQSSALSTALVLAPTASASSASVNGSATILGRTDNSGTTVSIVGTTISTTTAANGTFSLPNPPPGMLSLQFTNGNYSETLTGVLSLAGTNGQIFNGTSFIPLPPLEIPQNKRIVSGGVGALPYYTYSTDNTLGLYTDYVGGKYLLRVQNFVTGQLTTPVTDVDLYRLTPDNQRILYTTKNAGSNTWTLWTVPTSGGSPTILAVNLTCFGSISPDSNWLWFATPSASGSTYDMKLVATSGTGVARTVATVPASDFSSSGSTRYPASLFSANSQWFVFSGGPTLYSVPTSGSATATSLAENVSSAYTPAVYLNGSSYIVYRPSDTASGRMVSIPIAGGAPIVLIPSTGPSFFFDGLSPDGQYAAYDISGTGGGQFVVPVAGGTAVNLGAPTILTSVGWVVEPQGVTGVVWKISGALVYNNLTGTSPVTLTTASSLYSIPYVISPDGHTVYTYGTSMNVLNAYSLPTGASRQLTDKLSTSSSVDDFRLSPDGTRILFTNDDSAGRVLSTVSIASGTVTPVLRIFDGAATAWINNSLVRVRRLNTASPYGFQDGLYVVSVP